MKIISYSNLNRNLNRAATANATVAGGRSPSKACTPFKPLRVSQMHLNFKPNVIANADASISVNAADNAAATLTPATATASTQGAPVTSSRGSKENKDVEDAVMKDTKDIERDGLGLSIKDVRAFEHERQRTKRAEERASRRSKKGNTGFSRKGEEGRFKANAKGREAQDVDAEYVVGGVIADTSAAASRRLKNDVLPVLPSVRIESKPVEISLSELVFSQAQARSDSRERKARAQPNKAILGLGPGLGLGEEGFEWVPAVRAVIALDEVDFKLGTGAVAKNNVLGARDMDVDEPWECVSVDGDVETFSSSTSNAGDRDREFSYADIVLGKAGPASEVEETK